jgi:hypothetical protein
MKDTLKPGLSFEFKYKIPKEKTYDGKWQMDLINHLLLLTNNINEFRRYQVYVPIWA